MNKQTLIACPAKVNLFLKILEKDSSGYHKIETIMARCTAMQDFLQVEPAPEFSFECTDFPGESNLVVKAIRLLEKECGRRFNYKIKLEKHIPAQSGLGGASSNAAAIMLYLNETESLGMSSEKLMKLAATIGMDIPFFLSGVQLALASNYGEKIKPLKNLPDEININIQSGEEISTQAAYEKWDKSDLKSTADISQILDGIETQNTRKILEYRHNDFQLITPSFSSSSQTRHVLSGSGGAVAVFDVSNKSQPKISK